MRLHDLCGDYPGVHDPDSYAHAQALAKRLRVKGSHGIVYDSVRHRGARNIAVFRPRVLAAPRGEPHVVQGPHVRALWDGSRMTRSIVMGASAWTALC